MAKAKEFEPGEVSDPEHFGKIKQRVLNVMEVHGLLRVDGSGRPSTRKKAKGKFLDKVHSSVFYEMYWLVEELERVTGRRAQLPVPPLPEDDEVEEKDEEREETP